MKEQRQNILRQVPWKSVGAILLAGVLISAGIVLGTRSEPAQPEADGPVYTLTFLNEKGEIWEQQQVQAGSFARPPEVESVNDGIVFSGWSQKLYNINRSTEMTPVFQDLRQEQNAFYLDSQCVQPGDEAQGNLWLGGNVCLSAIELTLRYDPEVLLDFECDVTDSPFTLASEAPGAVVLTLNKESNLTEPVSAAIVRFRVDPERDDIAKTRIRIEMKGPAMMTDGGEVGANSCAVHGDIYLLS